MIRTVQYQRTKNGFTLIDILVAIAIFILITPSLIQYLFGFNVVNFIDSVSGYSLRGALRYDQSSLSDKSISENTVYAVDVSEKNCDIFASELLEAKHNKDAVVIEQVPIIDLDGNEVNLTDNAFTSIDYVGDTIWGHFSLLIGLNSASTSLPDIWKATFESKSKRLIVVETVLLGPGVVDIDVSPKVYSSNITKRISAVERSVVNPFWVGEIGSGLQSASGELKPVLNLNLAGAYPTVVRQYGDMFMIGTQKSLWSELVIGRVDSTMGVSSILFDKEMGSGVNDAFIDTGSLYIASVHNPELNVQVLTESVKQSIQTSIDRQTTSVPSRLQITSFDAPGELGNGKSLAPYPYGVFLGRTVGNQELYSLMKTKNNQHVVSANPNSSIRKMIYVFDGMGLIVLTNSDADAVKIYIQKPVANTYELQEIFSFDLESAPTDMICIAGRLFITTESEEVPLISIYISH